VLHGQDCRTVIGSVENWWNAKHEGTGRYTCFVDIAFTLFLPGYIQIIWLRRT